MTVARIGELAMDLVGDDREAAAQANLREPLELVAPEDPAHRVVRVAEQEEPRAVADRRGERVDVDFVASVRPARQRRILAGEVHVGGGAEDGRVHGRHEDEAVARRREHASGHVEARDHPGDDHHRFRGHAPAVALEQPVGEELVELGLLERDVAVDAVLHPLAQRADHGLGRLEVHVRHPERQDVGTVLLPLGAVRAPAVDSTIEVVAHGGSSYHARAREV